jgi:hypothetical protein
MPTLAALLPLYAGAAAARERVAAAHAAIDSRNAPVLTSVLAAYGHGGVQLGRGALFDAVLTGWVDGARAMLAAGAVDARASDHGGNHILHMVRESVPAADGSNGGGGGSHDGGGPRALVAALVEGGADLEARDREDRTALFRAVHNGCVALAVALLRAGARPNVTSARYSGAAPLHMIGLIPDDAFTNCLLPALLAAGADVNATDKRGRTPLLSAARRSSSAAVLSALLAAGADPTVKDEAGQTPLDAVRAQAATAAAAAARPGAGGAEDGHLRAARETVALLEAAERQQEQKQQEAQQREAAAATAAAAAAAAAAATAAGAGAGQRRRSTRRSSGR